MRVAPRRQRVVIGNVRPQVDCGTLAAKATQGLPLEVSADIVADGHDLLIGWVRHGRLRSDGSAASGWREGPLTAAYNDRWLGTFTPPSVGPYGFTVVALPDDYGTWLRDLRVRLEAGQELAMEFEVGARIVERHLATGLGGAAGARALARLAAMLRGDRAGVQRVRAAGQAHLVDLMRRTADRSAATAAGPFPLFVDRPLGGFSAWYEMFPRSEGAVPPRSGTLRTAARRLGAIAAMGFDIVYLPPIHPIGETFRKGPNNTLEPGPHDVGSPWAIGGPQGGHTAVHPDLGTLADFDFFVDAARRHGLEVALDIAMQCSPDHPWVQEHPSWFRQLPDGSMRYAENPPKRYQDIYPINFDSPDRTRLWKAVLDVFLFWAAHGVTVFRVDNPHTKPLPFWQWLLAEVRARHPGAIFLAEAFTRPRVMEHLAKVGFTQSYTYFTWRNTKQELSEYLTELSQTAMTDYFRPSFWPNTPDILHEFLQQGGPAAFRLRLVLAAFAAPSYGIYSGYELYENLAVRPGSEEYLDSEKYQLRPRDWARADSLAAMITLVNGVRRRHHEALALQRTLRLHHIANDAMLCFSRSDDRRQDVLLVIVNLDPVATREATTWLDLGALGISPTRPYEAHDELTGTTFTWQGPVNYIRLDPHQQPAHLLHLRPR